MFRRPPAPERSEFIPVQGGLDTSPGGLRDVCLAGFRLRDDRAPGYAIGGLAEEESKDNFWRVLDHCCRAFCDVPFYGISCAAHPEICVRAMKNGGQEWEEEKRRHDTVDHRVSFLPR